MDEMDVEARDEQRLDGMKVSTSTMRWEAGIGERERMTHGEDMKNGREGERVRRARIVGMDGVMEWILGWISVAKKKREGEAQKDEG